MSIFINEKTRVLFQGITGSFGTYHSQRMLDYGTNIVAGVTPGRGGTKVNGVPVYDSVRQVIKNHELDASIIMVPAPFIKDSVFEAIEAGIKFIACVVEGVPVQDMMLIKRHLEETETIMLGPNSPGLISPGKAVLGFMPSHIYTQGNIGIVARSGTFSYKVADSLTRAGLGQSTCVGIGGDPITGISFIEPLKMFEEDQETKAIVLVGEIGRTSEEEAAQFIKEHISKPVIGIILGRTAPEDKQMGHAGAVISAGRGTYQSKIKALQEAGVSIAKSASEVPNLVKKYLP